MMQVVGEGIEAHPYKEYSVDVAEGQSPVTAEITLEKDELYNLIDFIEIEFIDAIRRDMMNALQKLRVAYACLKLEETTDD